MNAKYVIGIFLSVICLISCVKEEWNLGEKETEHSTVVEGTVLSSNGMPLAGVDIRLEKTGSESVYIAG